MFCSRDLCQPSVNAAAIEQGSIILQKEVTNGPPGFKVAQKHVRSDTAGEVFAACVLTAHREDAKDDHMIGLLDVTKWVQVAV